MSKSTALMLLVFIVLLIGFLGYISIQGQIIKPTCNKPYIIVGHSCCLDQNDNAICDSDEESFEPDSPVAGKVIVSHVLNGYTIQISTGERIRLIGINTPEVGEPCSSEATEKLKELVLGKQVTLERDVQDKDQYDRLLRYVYVDDLFVNMEMVRLGLAHKYEYGANIKYSLEFEQAEDEAVENRGCLWKPSEDYVECIYISNFNFNAAGNDCDNLNDEYVTFGNKCPYLIDMTQWTIKDESSRNPYVFPSFVLSSDSYVTLYTGCGSDTYTRLFWCSSGYPCNAIWNNNGDTLYMRNAEGELVLTESYVGY